MAQDEPMSETPLPEPPKKRTTRSKILAPLVASVPSLVGVLVGAVTSHFAEAQKADFEREDRFRQSQIERIAAVAHAYDSMTGPLTAMIAAIQTQQPALCRFMPLASIAETRLRNANLLHGRLFSPGAVDPNGTADYGREVDALTSAADPGVKQAAVLLKTMIDSYVPMLASVDTADAQFAQKREAFQATLMFEVKVYFPERVRKDVQKATNAFAAIGKQAASVAAPNQLCTLDANGLSKKLLALTTDGTREMTSFAQSLEPELGDKS